MRLSSIIAFKNPDWRQWGSIYIISKKGHSLDKTIFLIGILLDQLPANYFFNFRTLVSRILALYIQHVKMDTPIKDIDALKVQNNFKVITQWFYFD